MSGAGIGVIITLLLGYFLFKSLASVLELLMNLTDRLIKADLTLQIEKKDYHWEELNQLTENFAKVAKGVRKWFKVVADHTDHLTGASAKIISGSEQVSAGSQKQAEKVQHLLLAIESMSRVSAETTGRAQDAVSISRNSVQTARDGDKLVLQVSESIELINTKISELNQRSNEIVRFLNLINEIASQTNLLALNAAIEAARAGEYGRGFAVVAEEVRKLAENASLATKEINDLVITIQASIKESVSAAAKGMENTKQVKEAFISIMKSIENTEKVIANIALSSREQAEKTDHIVYVIQSISTVAQEAAATSQEVTAVVHELDTLSEGLRKISEMWKFA
ncbi:MAG: methyl-accepting chemotaxis protein [Bacillota bacterium]